MRWVPHDARRGRWGQSASGRKDRKKRLTASLPTEMPRPAGLHGGRTECPLPLTAARCNTVWA